MTLSALTPTGIYGWAGLALMAGSFLYNKSLSTLGLVIGLGLGFYLYFVVDSNATPS
jgi:hypothetical protein